MVNCGVDGGMGDGGDGIVSEGVRDVVDVDVSGGEDCGNAEILICYLRGLQTYLLTNRH